MLSKGQIDKLGGRIRNQGVAIDDSTLNELQDYRLSHKEAFSNVFDILCKHTKSIHSTSIVTCRLKRFESIIRKLDRYKDMRFCRMWDIAGCRCILRSNDEVFRLSNLIHTDPDIEVLKTYDYIKEPQEHGYQSLHLFIKYRDLERVIEVQLRCLQDHNWATLVEISDLLFDSRIKEYSQDLKLLRFHYLLSKKNSLTIKEKQEIFDVVLEYGYFEKLSDVFARNNLKVRKQWLELSEHKTHKFFLIETAKDEIPKISSFLSFKDAESSYLETYKTQQNANIIVTHLHTPNYAQLSIAYSNYILTFHSFLFDCMDILEELIIDSLRLREYRYFHISYKRYINLLFRHTQTLRSEIKEMDEYTKSLSTRPLRRAKKKEWTTDMEKHLKQCNDRIQHMALMVETTRPKSYFGKLIIDWSIRRTSRAYARRLKNVLKS